MVHEGICGFLHGLDKYDLSKYPGIWNRCKQYTENFIHAYVMDSYSGTAKLSKSSNTRKIYFSFNKTVNQLGLKQPLSESEMVLVASKMKLKPRQVSQIVALISKNGETQAVTETGMEYATCSHDYDMLHEKLRLNSVIEEIRPILNKKELVVLNDRMLCAKEASCADIAERFGVSKSMIYQIETKIKKMIASKLECGVDLSTRPTV